MLLREVCSRSDSHSAHVTELHSHVDELRRAVEESAAKLQEFYAEASHTSADFVAKVRSAFEVMEGRDGMMAAAMADAASHQQFQDRLVIVVHWCHKSRTRSEPSTSRASTWKH